MSVSQRYESHDVKSSEGVNALMSAVLPGCILFLMYLKECCYLCPEINWVSDFFMANYDDAFSVCQVVCWNTGIFGVPFFFISSSLVQQMHSNTLKKFKIQKENPPKPSNVIL